MTNKLEEARRIIDDTDAQMAELFVRRMRAVETVCAYKREAGLPISDPRREDEVVRRNVALVEDEALKGYYADWLQHTMALSRAYQQQMPCDPQTIPVCLGEHSYTVVVERGVLAHAHQQLNLNRRVLVVTDDGVPAEYAQSVADQSKDSVVCTLAQGETAKSLDTLSHLLQTMLDHGFSRNDCVVAVGGGVVGDVAGFAASTYMRGVDFYNIPTTLLAQIDSSIGGKTAINLGGVKNVVGAFHQPKKVLIDPDLLHTLPPRQVANGLAEAIKMALIGDAELFSLFEHENAVENLDTVILRALQIKKRIVEQDEKESGLRKVLNFGHTIGHGIEVSSDLYHGECVALGMLPMCSETLRPRILALLEKYGLYRKMQCDWEKIAEAIRHDKKADGDTVTVVTVSEIGRCAVEDMPCDHVLARAKNCWEGL